MLTPEQLAVLPDEIVRQMIELEDFILDDISRRLAKNYRLTDTALQQMEVLARAGMEMEDLKSEIQKRMNITARDLKKIVNDTSALSYEQDMAAYLKGGKKLPSLAANPMMGTLIKSAADNAWDEMQNLTNTIGFVQNGRFSLLDDFYQQTLGQGVLQIGSGAADYTSVLRRSVSMLAASGVRMIDYDNTQAYHVDAAARRAVLTTVNQVTGQMAEANADMMEQDLMELTAHAGARPTHAVWQGELVSRSGRNGYLSLSEIGYGDVQGFMGANCRHNWYPYFEGISERMWSKRSLDRLDNPPFEYEGREYTHYEATQRMRQLKRNMRKTKRQLIGYDAAGLTDDFTAKSVYLRRQREQYLDFSSSAGLKPQLDRVGVQGYNRNISSKSVWAVRKDVASRATISKVPSPTMSVRSTSAFYKGVGQATQKALNHGIATGNECLTWVDLKGKEAFPPLIGSHNQVVFTQQLTDFLTNASPQSLISIHNHPSSSSFSDADLIVASKYLSIKQLRVIAHDGTKYYLKIGSGQRPLPMDIRIAFVTEQNRLMPKYMKLINNQSMTPDQAWKEHSHEINKALAKTFGWTYRRVR